MINEGGFVEDGSGERPVGGGNGNAVVANDEEIEEEDEEGVEDDIEEGEEEVEEEPESGTVAEPEEEAEEAGEEEMEDEVVEDFEGNPEQRENVAQPAIMHGDPRAMIGNEPYPHEGHVNGNQD